MFNILQTVVCMVLLFLGALVAAEHGCTAMAYALAGMADFVAGVAAAAGYNVLYTDLELVA